MNRDYTKTKWKPHFTDKEIQYIKDNYSTIPTRIIAKKLKRTLKSIHTVAERFEIKKKLTGSSNSNWRGGKAHYDGRYNLLFGKQECPYATKDGTVREHIYVWWKHYPNDPILMNEVIHHINQDRKDNRIENLQKMTRAEHMKLHNNLKKGG